MASFRVGQRVRIVYAYNYPECVGLCGTVVRIDDLGPVAYGVATDDAEFNKNFITGFGWASPDQLEPIVDDGRQVISWSECVWRPESEHAHG